MGQAIRSKTVTMSAERPWVDVGSPVYYVETKMLDFSVAFGSAIDTTHPWYREDKKFVVPSGVPLARDVNGDARLVFPVKRARLSAAVTDTDTDYPVKNTKPFVVGDEIVLAAGGTPQAITAIDHVNKVLTVGTTIGQAGSENDELLVEDLDTAIGMLTDAVDVTQSSDDVPVGCLVNGYIFPAVVTNSIFELTDQIVSDLKAANIKVNPATWALV